MSDYQFPPEQADVDRLVRHLHEFLSKPVCSQDGSWPIVSDDDKTKFAEIVGMIVDYKWARDCDHDRVVECHFTDRRIHQRCSYTNVRYLHKATTRKQVFDHLFAVMANVSIANGCLDDVLRQWQAGYLDKELSNG